MDLGYSGLTPIAIVSAYTINMKWGLHLCKHASVVEECRKYVNFPIKSGFGLGILVLILKLWPPLPWGCDHYNPNCFDSECNYVVIMLFLLTASMHTEL